MGKVLLVLAVIVGLVGCHGGDNIVNPNKIVCFSGGQQISEHTTNGIVWRGSGSYAFDLDDGTAINVNGDCIVTEVNNG